MGADDFRTGFAHPNGPTKLLDHHSCPCGESPTIWGTADRPKRGSTTESVAFHPVSAHKWRRVIARAPRVAERSSNTVGSSRSSVECTKLGHRYFGIIHIIHTLQQRCHAELQLRDFGVDGRRPVATISSPHCHRRTRPFAQPWAVRFWRLGQLQFVQPPGECAYLASPVTFAVSLGFLIR